MEFCSQGWCSHAVSVTLKSVQQNMAPKGSLRGMGGVRGALLLLLFAQDASCFSVTGLVAGRAGSVVAGRHACKIIQMTALPPPPPRDKESRDLLQEAKLRRKPPPPPPLGKRSHLASVQEEEEDWLTKSQQPDLSKKAEFERREMSGMFYKDPKGNLRKMKFVFDHENDDIEDDLRYDEWQTGAVDDGVEWDEWRKRASDWMFFDHARVYVSGGDGGDGIVAIRREKYVDAGGPWGGSGGRGGNVIFEATGGDNTLARVRARTHIRATGGQRGQGKGCHGYSGTDITILVPVGTIVREEETERLVADLTKEGDKVVVARGGQGGRGNLALKTPQNTVPEFAELGEKGEARWLKMELKLVADVGIVGVPNAGKSTLISAVTNARPKIADYPFTTVVPNLGVCQLPGAECQTLVLADIPGLIEGAHAGVGLGHAFLRHVERCRVLIHLIDGSAEDPIYNYKAIENELELFNPDLAKKPKVILVNKMDLPHVRERWPSLRDELKKLCGHGRVDAVSAATNMNILPQMIKVKKLVDSLPPEENVVDAVKERQKVEEEEQMRVNEVVKIRYGVYQILADKRLQKAVAMTNFEYDEAVDRFYRILEATGIRALLTNAGCKPGDTVVLEGYEFEFQPEQNLMEMNAREDGFYD